MKQRLTLTIDAKLLVKAYAIAAERGMSLNQFINEVLVDVVRQRRSFDIARRRALERLRVGLDLHWTPPLSRDDLHQR
jgi:hypothetical protein